MDFDFDLVTAPFRMQPGLRKLGPGARHLTSLLRGSLVEQEKRAAMAAGRTTLAVPGFNRFPALVAIADQSRLDGAPFQGGPLELAFEEDLAVLDGETGKLVFLCVCLPSHWAPEDKIGLDFAGVHAPVADAATLLAAGEHLVRLATGGERWERHVWTVSPSLRHDQHPRRHARTPWPDTQDPEEFAGQCYFRAERQTFFPVGQGTRQAVFTIRVMLAGLRTVVDTPQKARRLHDALATMSEAVLAYKGLAPARARLLAWLAQRIA